MAAGDLPALEFIDAEMKAAAEVQERRADSLDTKAGYCLGIAGLLAGLLLRGGAASSALTYLALSVDFTVALLSLLGYRIRTYPHLVAGQLRRYIDDDERLARVAVFDARLVIYEEANRELTRKARLVNAALTGLLLGVIATAVAAGQSIGAGYGVR